MQRSLSSTLTTHGSMFLLVGDDGEISQRMIRSYRDNTSSTQVVPGVFLHSLECSASSTTMWILTGFSITSLLLVLPLSLSVLHLGCQRWRQRSRLPAATWSHADIFTYNAVAMEMFTMVGCLLYCVGAYTHLSGMVVYSLEVFASAWCIKIHFHTLTCLEQYLAVVRPVAYLSLRTEAGARIRNVCIGCVWLLCLVWGVSINFTTTTAAMIVYLSLVGFALAVICFCCIAVLCALRRPGPGAVGGSQTKRRAFSSIVTILAVLLLCLGGMLLGDTQVSQQPSDSTCLVMSTAAWFTLPSSFVLPLLFLHRAGKLPTRRHNGEPGRGSDHV